MYPPSDDLDVVVHAERLLVSRERVAVERVRFTKRIVTTTRTIEVPVRVEQLVVSHEPLPEGAARARGDLTDGREPDPGELVIVLHEEFPEVSVRVRPVERVTIAVRSVTHEETVTTELRRETVDLLPTSGGRAGNLNDPSS